ncbi:hypothetical protein STENM327S_08191 [Streptomyces tendae]
MTALAREDGIRQFLDIGTGLPTAENVHQIAQRIAPESRVVYVDNDPVVLAHARALLTSGPEGRTDYIDADLKSPARILEQAAATLDFDRPVALCLVAILHFVDDEEAYPIVRVLMDALPAGSRLVLSHLTEDLNPQSIRAVQRTYTERGFTFVLRSRKDVERFFTETGLELAEPGVVPVHHWRPDHAAPVPEQPGGVVPRRARRHREGPVHGHQRRHGRGHQRVRRAGRQGLTARHSAVAGRTGVRIAKVPCRRHPLA